MEDPREAQGAGHGGFLRECSGHHWPISPTVTFPKHQLSHYTQCDKLLNRDRRQYGSILETSVIRILFVLK